MKAYEKMLVRESVVSFFYQLSLMVVVASTSMLFIFNKFDLSFKLDDIQKDPTLFNETTVYFTRYFKFYYGFNFIFMLDYFIRLSYADYSYNTISRTKAFLLAPLRWNNLLDLASFIIVIVVYNVSISQHINLINDDTLSLNTRLIHFDSLVFDKTVMGVFPGVILAKLLGLHNKIIQYTIISGETKLFTEVFKRRWKILLSSFMILLTISFFFGFILFRIEQDYYRAHPEILITSPEAKQKTIFDTFWYVFGTITTIAYGDIVPLAVVGKAFSIVLGLIGVTYFGFITSLFASGILAIIGERREQSDNRRLIAFKNENERLMYEFSEKIKTEIVAELLKHNIVKADDESDIKTDLNINKEHHQRVKRKRKLADYFNELSTSVKTLTKPTVKIIKPRKKK